MAEELDAWVKAQALAAGETVSQWLHSLLEHARTRDSIPVPKSNAAGVLYLHQGAIRLAPTHFGPTHSPTALSLEVKDRVVTLDAAELRRLSLVLEHAADSLPEATDDEPTDDERKE